MVILFIIDRSLRQLVQALRVKCETLDVEFGVPANMYPRPELGSGVLIAGSSTMVVSGDVFPMLDTLKPVLFVFLPCLFYVR